MKKFNLSDVFKKSPVAFVTPLAPVCGAVSDGQEFVVDDMKMPEGFCGSAWSVIRPDVMTLAHGGNFPGYKDKGVAMVCCTNGMRPVVFKLERV